MDGLLENARRNGFAPRTIIDIGAYIGEWSGMAGAIFPDARIFMFDGNPANQAALEATTRALGGRARMAIQLLGSDVRDDVKFYQMGTGSSVLEELTEFRRNELSLSMRPLDDVLRPDGVSGPALLKVDVQGFELDVLRGAEETLAKVEFVILETSLLEFNKGAPLMSEVVAFMKARDFVSYDFCGQARRQTDHALHQTDIAFVRADSALRSRKKFFLVER